MVASVRLEVDAVSFAYRSKQALEDIGFTATGGVVGLVGANGAGKTTLLKLLAGILEPDNGTITMTGEKGRAVSVGFLPQSPAATALLSAQAYVEYFGALAGLPGRRLRERTLAALDLVGMVDRARTRTSKLSGGMFRRVALAAALVAEPDVLLLDEPTAGLDPVQRVRFRELVGTLARGRTVVVASHLLEDIEPIADSVLVLNGTRLVFDGSVAELAAKGEAVVPTAARPSLEAAFVAMLGDGIPS